MSAQNLSHEQLAMYMTPDEIKRDYRVKPDEFDPWTGEETEEHLYNRKREESKKTNIEGWPKRGRQVSLFTHIQKHGVQEPVLLDAATKEVEHGHHRIASAPEKSLIPVEYKEEW